MVTANEFSHVVKLSEIGSHSRNLQLIADEAARSGLIKRFELAALDSLDAQLSLELDGADVIATGRFTADLAQICIATGEPVRAFIDEPIHIRFIPEPSSGGDTEIELGADDCDTMFQDGQTIDLGEAVAQSMGLSLNPYPRSPEAEKILRTAGVKSDDELVTSGALSGLKDLLAKK